MTAVCGCLLATLAGGAFGAWRMATNIRATVVDWGRLRPSQDAAFGTVRWIDTHATLDLVAPDWRPLIVRFDLAVPAGTPAPGPVVQVEADGWPIGELRPGPGRSTHQLPIRVAPARREKLQLRFLHQGGPPIALRDLTITPFTWWSVNIRHGFAGALTGLAFGLLWFVVRLPRAPSTAVPLPDGPSFGRRAAVFAAVAAYLTLWAGLKPVLQAPDEPQHLMKANAVLKQPWLTAGAQFDHDPRFVNPLPLWTPPELGKVFFRGDLAMSEADVDAVKRADWVPADRRPGLETYHVALASYPTVYYFAAFVLAEPVIAASKASAYQAIFVYRMVTVLLAALAWTAVYVELRRTDVLRPRVPLLLLFLLANPMLAFVSASVNTDALSIPLCICGALASWRLLSTGTGHARALAWLVLAALVKPAGLQMMVAVGVASLGAWSWSRTLHPIPALICVGRALATSYALFYGWSYIHLYAGGPLQLGVFRYASTSARLLGDTWVMYWGQLGWLDYTLPVAFYFVVFGAFVWALREAWRRPGLGRETQIYFGLCFVVFAATMYAVEYSYLREAGLIIQGRYFLPASIGLAPLLFHRSTAARLALVGSVVVLNVGLMAATIQRYYGDDWRTAWRALPFDAAPEAAGPAATPAAARAGDGTAGQVR